MTTVTNSINGPYPIAVGTGGTGAQSFVAYMPTCGGTTTTAALQSVSTSGASAGYVLTFVSTAALPTWQAAGGGGLSFNAVSGTTQAAAVNTGYICQNASLTTVTLPATAALGSVVVVVGQGAGGWTLAANTGQTVQVGATASSSAGSASSVQRYDNIQVVCIVANTTWSVFPNESSGFTIV